MRAYKCLHTNQFSEGNYSLVPIRDEDKYDILNWRNTQIKILRQQAPLTKEQQDIYFKTTVAQLFEETTPDQLLFSFLEKGKLIGYGGLVHIDWKNKSAEISFLTETSRNDSKELFIGDWCNYLSLIKKVAKELNFNSMFTYAYDIRPTLYTALEKAGFTETKRTKNGIEIDGILKDIVIHSFYLSPLKMRMATAADVGLYFNWANDKVVRENSFTSSEITYEQHVNWFTNKLNSEDCFFYLFLNEQNIPIGQVRIDKTKDEIVIGISIDEKQRGKGFGVQMLNKATAEYLNQFPGAKIIAYIKEDNVASLKLFTSANFIKIEDVKVGEYKSHKFQKTKNG
ncbi:MAG: GNAT family N-acetyltransferase [Bacteroidia bacterium]|nr:GNAT family N-acetyltransferase [Bacteroidia bacterium]